MIMIGPTLSAVSKIVTSLRNAIDKIEDVIQKTRTLLQNVSCSLFISYIEELIDISYNVSNVVEIVQLSTKIENLQVQTCTSAQISLLQVHKVTLKDILSKYLPITPTEG